MNLLVLKVAWRSFSKSGFITFLNIAGLGLVFSAVFLITLFVKSEYETDSGFKKRSQIFRIVRDYHEETNSYKSPTLAAPFKENIITELGIPQDRVLRLFQDDELAIVDRGTFFETNVLYSDREFFDFFEHTFLAGNPKLALNEPNSIVISARVAEKYFGNREALGKLIHFDGKGEFEITGVIEKISPKSHLSVDLIAPINSMGYSNRLLKEKNLHSFSFYLMLNEVEQSRFVENFENLTSSFFLNTTSIIKPKLSLQPLSAIYFEKDLKSDFVRHGDRQLTNSLAIIGGIILLITGVNFLNLTLSIFLKRLRNIGVHKILGARVKTLIARLFFESYISTLVAGLFALVIILSISSFLEIRNLLPEIYSLFSLKILSIFISFTALFAFVFSIYPALVIIYQKPKNAILSKMGNTNSLRVQNALLVFQFSAAVAFVTFSFVVGSQYNYMENRETGLQKEHLMVFSSNNKHSWKNRNSIREEIGNRNDVESVAMAYGGLPGYITETLTYSNTSESRNFKWNTAFVSLNFPELVRLKLLEGRFFESNSSSDWDNKVILNETAARESGWPQENILNRQLTIEQDDEQTKVTVIGIIEDYHYDSFKKRIEPLALQAKKWGDTFVVKLFDSPDTQTLSAIEKIWKNYVPDYPFSYQFLGDIYSRLNSNETKHKDLLYYLATLSVIISAIGVLGLSTYTLSLRVKEITIRSIFGAGLKQIIVLFSSSYAKLLIISILIALPFSWTAGQSWLSEFSYRVTLDPFVFILGSFMVLALVLSLLSLQIWRFVVTNPVKNLKTYQ